MKLKVDSPMWVASVDGYDDVTAEVSATAAPMDVPPAIRLVLADAWVDLIGRIVEVKLTRGDRSHTVTGLVESVVSTPSEQRTVIVGVWPLEPEGKAT